jgi:non-ribosomal peptide synthetase component F
MSDLEVAPQDASDALVRGDPLLLHEYFTRAVRRWPQHIAIDVPPGPDRPERQQITYAELARQVGLLTQALQPVVGAECVVAILLPRASHLPFAAQLAVLQAGAAYTCLDGSLPDEHLAWVLADSGAVAVVTDAAGKERLTRFPGPLPRVIDVAECAVRQRPGV